MAQSFSTTELEAYLDEALPPARMSEIEKSLRKSAPLRQQLAGITARRDAGVHSLGSVWRRHRASCATRDQMGAFLLGALPAEEAEYVRFHVEEIGCRVCAANLQDLQRRLDESQETVDTRRKKYFQSSAGYLQPGARRR